MSNSAHIENADVAFLRFEKLSKRGYRSKIVISSQGSLHAIEFEHPSCTKKRYIPKVAVWSDGVLATNGLLWPNLHVPSQRVPPPSWQKAIAPNDAKTFDGFVASVPLPSFVDKRIRPVWRSIQNFAFRMIFGSSLCVALAVPTKLLASALGVSG